jgi:hypothetical protein
MPVAAGPRRLIFRHMQLLVITVLGLVAMLVGYAFGLGGAVSFLIFLTLLFIGALIRVARPLIDALKP